MRYVRYLDENNIAQYGWVDDRKVGKLSASPFGIFRRNHAEISFESINLLPPVLPSKIIAVGRNYVEHAREHEVDIPDYPLLFLKPPSSLIASGQPIILPPQSQQVEHEIELAVIIGRRGRWIKPESAEEYIFGYSIGLDITARDLQQRDNQWTRSKGFDSFCPLGPWVETDFNTADAMLRLRVNNTLRQIGSTKDMVFNIPQIIVYASSFMTLEAGDVILTGTPAGVSPLREGDTIEAEIEGIGTLVHTVKSERLDIYE